jgi:hypothetical protein
LIHKKDWEFIPLVEVRNYKVLSKNAKKPIILKNGNNYLYLTKEKLFGFSFYPKAEFSYLRAFFLGYGSYNEPRFIAYFNPINALSAYSRYADRPKRVREFLKIFVQYKKYIKPYLAHQPLEKFKNNQLLEIGALLYKIENAQLDTAIKYYKRLQNIVIPYIYNPNPGGINPLKEGKVNGTDIVYYTQANVILKNKILSEYFNKLKKAKNIEEVYKLIKTYEGYDQQDYIINYKTPATKSFKNIEKNIIMKILKKDIQNTLSNKNYKKFMKIVDLTYKISYSDIDFTGLSSSGDRDYINIVETYLAKLYFPTTCCKKVSSVFDLKYDIHDFSKNYACIKCQKQFKGGMRVCKVCGNIKNGVINNGEVTVYYIKAANTWLFSELWRTKEFKGKFNSFKEIKPLIKKLQQLAIADYNKKNGTYKNEQSSSPRIAIKNCSDNKCYIYSYGNYDGLVTWFYEDGYYRLTFSNRSGWGNYYPNYNELDTGRCGKTNANSLDIAIDKFVKCYYIGHY